MRILVDMDGVIADWGAGYNAALDAYGEEAAGIRRHRDQRSFDLHEGCTPDEIRIIGEVMVQPNFYRRLRAIPGAITALREMVRAGHDVRIVTSPWIGNPTCASDKLDWVVHRLGRSWGQRTVITMDKTLVRGDILIDDKPEVRGSMTPEWEHVYFTQPYNRELTGKRRLDAWASWEEIINGCS